MTDLDTLLGIAFKRERAASRRLARAYQLPADEALRRTLQASAGPAGLDALVAARLAAQAAVLAARATRERERLARPPRPAPVSPPDGWQAWFDGSARPNPGRCAIGALLRGPGGIVREIAEPAGIGDSSAAEYRALIAVLDAALALGATGLMVHGDSRVVIDDVNGPDAAASPALAAYRERVLAQLARLPGVRLTWVPRHRNQQADALSQRAFSKEEHGATIAVPH